MIKDSKLVERLWNKLKKSATIAGLFTLGYFTLNPTNAHSQTDIDTSSTEFYTMYVMPYSEAYKDSSHMDKISKELIKAYKKDNNTDSTHVRLTNYKGYDYNEIIFFEKTSPYNEVKYSYNKSGIDEIDYSRNFHVYKIESDNNRNGIIEKTYYMKNNKTYKLEYDINENGIIDKTVLIKDGKPHTMYNKKDKIKKRIKRINSY